MHSRSAASARSISVQTARTAGTTSMEKLMTVKTVEPRTEVQSLLTRRPRRLRRTEAIRALVRETIVRPEDLIYPLFVVPNSRPRVEIGSMPGVFQMRVREIVEEAARAFDNGIRAVLLFGLPERKDATG